MSPTAAQRRSWRRSRTVAKCRICRQELPGVTTIEQHPNAHPPERRYHHCDECREKVRARPLVAVLDDYLDG